MSALRAAEIGDRPALHPRSVSDFLDALVSLGLLARDGDGATSRYANTADTALFLDKRQPAYIGGLLEMANERLYPFWGNLTKRCAPANRRTRRRSARISSPRLYSDEARLELFLRAMQGIQLGPFMALVERIDLSNASVLCDVGGANGTLSAIAVQHFPNLRAISFDLAPVVPVAERHLKAMGVDDRVTTVAGDFFADDLPKADVITMGNILHDWNEDEKRTLIGKAYAALPAGGRFIAIENLIDDDRRANTFGLLMSLNMLIETPGGFDYTPAQFDGWCRAAGFTRTEVLSLAGPTSAAVAYK